MKILFIGNHQGAGNSTDEEPDERHIARELGSTGVDVTTLPQDEWRAFCIGAKKDNVPEGEYDIILISKWNYWNADMVETLRWRYKGKVVYWVWDFMWHPERDWWTADWHRELLDSVDYYMSGEMGLRREINKYQAKHLYYNWDGADRNFMANVSASYTRPFDVAFTGSYIEYSYRNDLLAEVNQACKLTVHSWDYKKWQKEGFNAEPGKYGKDYSDISRDYKVILCMNWIKPRQETHGYWSNRVGKVLLTGGLPLVHFVPGMEHRFPTYMPYFYGEDDLLKQIKKLLATETTKHDVLREHLYKFGRDKMGRLDGLVKLFNYVING